MLFLFSILFFLPAHSIQPSEAFKPLAPGVYLLGRTSTWSGTSESSEMIVSELLPPPIPFLRFPKVELRVFRNGKESGRFKVEGSKPYACGFEVGSGTGRSLPPLERGEAIVATFANAYGSHEDRLVPLSAEQKLSFRELIAEQVEAKGANQSLLSNLILTRMTAFRIRDGGDLFVSIAATSGKAPESTLASAHVFRFLEKEKVWASAYSQISLGLSHEGAAIRESFLDRFDFDGDGTDEIVSWIQGYEGEHYQILRFAGEEWKVVYESEPVGC